jgi:hypothetical protein
MQPHDIATEGYWWIKGDNNQWSVVETIASEDEGEFTIWQQRHASPLALCNTGEAQRSVA